MPVIVLRQKRYYLHLTGMFVPLYTHKKYTSRKIREYILPEGKENTILEKHILKEKMFGSPKTPDNLLESRKKIFTAFNLSRLPKGVLESKEKSLYSEEKMWHIEGGGTAASSNSQQKPRRQEI